MTKVSDFADSVDELIALTPGKSGDVNAALSGKMPTTDSLTVGSPQDDDAIAIVRTDQHGNKTYLRCSINDILNLAQTGGGGTLAWKSPDGKQGTAATLNIVQGLQGEEDLNDNTQLNLSASDEILGQIEAPSFLSLSKMIQYANTHTDPDDTMIWFGPSVLSETPFVAGDSSTHRIDVSPRPNKTSEHYLLIFAVSCFGMADSDGYVRISVRTKTLTGSNVLLDTEGSPFVLQKHYKSGENLGQLILAGVLDVSATQELSFHLEHTFNGQIMYGHSTEQPGVPQDSFFLLQAADARLDAVTYLEHVTSLDVKWSLYSFKNPLADLSPTLKKSRAVKSYPVGQSGLSSESFYENDFGLIPLYDNVDMGISNGVMTISSSSLSLPCFCLIKIVTGKSLLHLFRNKGVGATVTLSPGSEPMHFVILASSFDVTDEGFSQPITGVDGSSGSLILGDDWSILASDYIAADPTQKRKGSVTTTFNQDVDNFPGTFIIALASGLRENFSVGIEEFLINVYPPFHGIVLKGPIGVKRPEISLHLLHSIFQLTGPMLAINSKSSYPIGATSVKLPPGQLSEPPALPTYFKREEGANFTPLDGYIKFSDDASATKVETTITLQPTSSLISNNETRTITFTWSKYSSGTATPIPGSNHSFTIEASHGNVANTISWSFVTDFLANDEIGLSAVATAGVGDAAEIRGSGTTKQIPLIEVSLTK